MDEDSGERELEHLPPDYDGDSGVAGGRKMHGEDVRVLEWVEGLPSCDDLVPLSQPLVSPELASAFSIATQHTASNLRLHQNLSKSSSVVSHLKPLAAADPKDSCSSQKSTRCPGNDAGFSAVETMAEIDGDSTSLPAENSAEDNSCRMLKRPRLVWTPQLVWTPLLHKRFVVVVDYLGINNAVPETIMQLMKVDGLTRENVASHLQTFRLYLKRMQGVLQCSSRRGAPEKS